MLELGKTRRQKLRVVWSLSALHLVSIATVVGTFLVVRRPQLPEVAEGLVIVDYKTDHWRSGADHAARLARYRHQLAAYGRALGALLDEPIAGGILVRCRADGPAEQLAVPDWAAALEEVSAGVPAP